MTAEPIPSAPVPVVPALRPVAYAPVSYVPIALCRCGHEPDAHGNGRVNGRADGGADGCAVCGPARCRGYRGRTGRGARSSSARRT